MAVTELLFVGPYGTQAASVNTDSYQLLILILHQLSHEVKHHRSEWLFNRTSAQ